MEVFAKDCVLLMLDLSSIFVMLLGRSTWPFDFYFQKDYFHTPKKMLLFQGNHYLIILQYLVLSFVE